MYMFKKKLFIKIKRNSKAELKGLPIATPSSCQYILLMKLNFIDLAANSINSNTSSEQGGIPHYRTSKQISIVSLSRMLVEKKTANIRTQKTLIEINTTVLNKFSKTKIIWYAIFWVQPVQIPKYEEPLSKSMLCKIIQKWVFWKIHMLIDIVNQHI